MKKKIAGIMVIIWMAVIFFFSSQPGAESTKTSDTASYQIIEWQNYLFHQKKSEAELRAQIETMGLVVRKIAHMSEYALLTLLLAFYLSCYSFSRRDWLLLAWGITVLYAVSDEIHQLFVPGRAGKITDVCIDSVGAGIGVLLICLLLKKRKKYDT